MGTSMVTARMDEFKKARGNAVLKKHGKTPSGVINELYDRIIKEDGLPWENVPSGIASMTSEEVAEARKFLSEIQVEDSPFATMSDGDIRRERLQAKGLV